jgi:hypothetical protein
MREVVTSELAQTGQPAPRSEPKATDAFVRQVRHVDEKFEAEVETSSKESTAPAT